MGKTLKQRVAEALTAEARRRGRLGGQSRAARLTPEQRSEIARKAAAARWKDHQPAAGEPASD